VGNFKHDTAYDFHDDTKTGSFQLRRFFEGGGGYSVEMFTGLLTPIDLITVNCSACRSFPSHERDFLSRSGSVSPRLSTSAHGGTVPPDTRGVIDW
jgi:hypothetical protein